ncbi:hypothetical protein M3J09_003711 [Ascochyta lentis]
MEVHPCSSCWTISPSEIFFGVILLLLVGLKGGKKRRWP